MKVLLIGNYRGDGQESMQRFAAMMEEGLERAGHEVTVVRPPVMLSRLAPVPGSRKWLAYVDKYAVFPRQLRSAARGVDVAHICDHSNAMYARWCEGTPCVVTCHDMLAVRGALGEQTDCPASYSGRWLQRWIVQGLRRADAVVSVSSATARDVGRIVGLSEGKRSVVLNALNYPYQRIPREEALRRLSSAAPLDLSRPFVLHVGSNLVRKNRPGVIRAFARACREVDLQLVLAGPPLTEALRELIRTEGIADRVTVMVKPGNEELEALFNLALLFFFPSRYEGFGWPLIEAQACGCPVLCSRCEPFAEVVGDTALVRAAEDEAGFACDIVRLAGDSGERCKWVDRGLQNVLRFGRYEMIGRYLEVYRELGRQA